MAYNDIVQAIADAETDAQTLEDVVNGEPNTQAQSRLGRLIYSLSTINHRVDVATNRANQKLTELQAAINTAAAAGAGANGWTDTLIAVSENVNQRQINDGLDSIAEMLEISNPRNGMRVYVKSYYAGLGKGGGTFVYDSTKANINDNTLVINGWVRQDTTQLTLDMFGAKPNDPAFDNTDALNKAFATGRDIHGKKDDVYYVNGILNTKGQQLLGGWKISTSRHSLGVVATDIKAVSIDKYIRMMFVESAYDLAELLHIKALGINLITHYAHFKATQYDANGTVQKLLDNCKSIGLKVLMSTESPPSREGALGEFITNHSKHEAVWGWYAYDEPAGRNISVAIQEESIDWFRTLTDKPITVADGYHNININPFSKKYDYVFAEGYPQGYDGDGRIQDARVDQDLQRARLSFGLMEELTQCQNIIPTLGLFTYNSPPYHCGDKVQVVRTAKEFIKAGNGNYAVFCWDSESDPNKVDNIRSTQEFKDFLKESAMMNTKNKYVTDILSFGGSSSDYMYGITDALSRLVVKDTNTTDTNIAKNMYPAILRPSTDGTQSDRYHLISQQTYSGLAMKHEECAIVLDMKTRKYVTCKLFYMNIGTSQSAGSFRLLATSDGGYTTDVLYDTGFTNATMFNFFSRPPNPNDNVGIRMTFSQDAVGEFYRKYLTGIIVASDW